MTCQQTKLFLSSFSAERLMKKGQAGASSAFFESEEQMNLFARSVALSSSNSFSPFPKILRFLLEQDIF
jgi:hypothetical protein